MVVFKAGNAEFGADILYINIYLSYRLGPKDVLLNISFCC